MNKFFTKLIGKVTLKDINFDKAWSMVQQLGNRISDFKLLLNMAQDSIKGKFKMSSQSIAVLAAGIIYVIMPVDLIPDFLPGGLVDDAAVIGIVLQSLEKEIIQYKQKFLK